ncbi:MAG: hypothetical protein Fur0010_04500 [Bdellovibrio sp.]
MDEPSSSTRRLVEQKRKMPHLDDWQAVKFEEEFVLSEDSDKIEVRSSVEQSSTISLPFFTQVASEQRFEIEGIRGMSFILGQESLSKFSQELGLDLDLPEVRFQFGKGYIFKVNSKDLACDFMNSQIEVSGIVKTTVRPLPSQIQSLEKFYQLELMKDFSSIMKMNVSKSKKSVLFGYRIGGKLKDHVQDNNIEQVEKDFLYLMDLLVDENDLKPTRLVTKHGDDYIFSHDLYEISTDVQVVIK